MALSNNNHQWIGNLMNWVTKTGDTQVNMRAYGPITWTCRSNSYIFHHCSKKFLCWASWNNVCHELAILISIFSLDVSSDKGIQPFSIVPAEVDLLRTLHAFYFTDTEKYFCYWFLNLNTTAIPYLDVHLSAQNNLLTSKRGFSFSYTIACKKLKITP